MVCSQLWRSQIMQIPRALATVILLTFFLLPSCTQTTRPHESVIGSVTDSCGRVVCVQEGSRKNVSKMTVARARGICMICDLQSWEQTIYHKVPHDSLVVDNAECLSGSRDILAAVVGEGTIGGEGF